MYVLLPLFEIAVRVNATLTIACIGYSVLVEHLLLKARCDPILSLDTFYVTFVTPFTSFGSTVRGKGNSKMASIGHSVLGNPKVRYDTGFSIVFFTYCSKYVSIFLPLFFTPFGVAVRGKGKLKILALISPYSEKPKVRHVGDFNLGSFT